MKKGMLFEAVAVTLLILLSFTMYVMVTTSSSSVETWSVSGLIAPPDRSIYSPSSLTSNNMFIGENGLLYTIDGKSVHAIDNNGNVLWSMAIPDHYNMTIRGITYNLSAVGAKDTWVGLGASVYNDTLYLLVVPTSPAGMPRHAPGHIAWRSAGMETSLLEQRL